MSNQVQMYLGDCLEEMKRIADGSVDSIICDPPYGITECSWDSVIPFIDMWQQIKRVIKPDGAVILFGSQPFTSALVMSNPKWYRYDWIWKKNNPTGFLDAKRRPMNDYETISVFSCLQTTYNPQGVKPGGVSKTKKGIQLYSSFGFEYLSGGENYPRRVIEFDRVVEGVHPTQKPIDLLAYLIRTYTNRNEIVLDFTMGSGSTGVAAIQECRKFIGIERDETYFNIAAKRIADASRAAQRLPKQLTGTASDFAGLPMFSMEVV